MTFQFGKRSKSEVATCTDDIQKVLNLSIKRSKVDFGVSEGHRPVEKQQDYYAIGRTTELHRIPITNIDGVSKLGKHNFSPSEAFDIYIYTTQNQFKESIIWNTMHLSYVAGVIDSCAKELYEKGEISTLIRWGGNWDGDGVIQFDQTFNDKPHFESINP